MAGRSRSNRRCCAWRGLGPRGGSSRSSGQLGDGTTTSSRTPVQVKRLSGVVAVSAGFIHSLALRTDGTVWAWGDNAAGQLGNQPPTNVTTAVRSLLN
ncbi:hypothetical protein [Cystobacter fuscus]|uniref:hypothetical protein n=1 Tax=Cystobacter fuscus TaxID=43 RepID=UPI0037BE31E1